MIEEAATRIPSKMGNLMMVVAIWRGRTYVLKIFFPQAKLPSRKEVESQIQGIYPGAKVRYTSVVEKEPGETFLYAEGVELDEGPKYDKEGNDKFDRYKRMVRHKQDKYGVSTLKQRLKHGGVDYNIDNEKKTRNEDWQKKSGKNPEGGLNEKGRKSYERENPGSDLKRPSKKVGNKRRASFCARMKGMKKKLTSAKTASDPDSRINKSLRAWNC